MFSIVFIGNNDEIHKRFPLYEKAIGAKNSTYIILSDKAPNNYAKLLAKVRLENTVFIISSEAVDKEQLMLFLIKNTKYLFLDFTNPLPLSLINKYIKYKVESGVKISVNISPYMAIKKEIIKYDSPIQHIQITSISENNITDRIFKYLIFITEMLNSDNIKCKFHLISDEQNNTNVIVADAFNLQEKYIHITVGKNRISTQKVVCYGKKSINKKNINEQELFEQPQLLKKQLTELAKGFEVGNVNTAIIVTKLFEKLKSMINKLGFSITTT